MSSIWALLAAFEDPLPFPDTAETFPFEGAFVKGVDSISWMANNNKKILNFQKDGPHCWTFLSTAAYGKQNKVPQVGFPPCIRLANFCTLPTLLSNIQMPFFFFLIITITLITLSWL